MLDELLEKFGGPVQYLQSELGSEPGPAWAKFAEELQVAFPCRPDLSYISGPVLPKQQLAGDTFKLSLWQLGWTAGVSTKPITYSVTAKALLDEFLVNSVITETEPLLLYQGPDTGLAKDSADNPIFFTHYVKGAARATSMLFLAHVVLRKLRADLESLQPGLYRSLTVLYGRVASAATDAQSIAIENARLSSRGAIRKSHDIITWLGKLAALKAIGLDPPQVIARYNESATRDSVLEGARRTALMQMLPFSKESTDVLLKHVSRFGEKSAFTNEAFSNKRLYPSSKGLTAATGRGWASATAGKSSADWPALPKRPPVVTASKAPASNPKTGSATAAASTGGTAAGAPPATSASSAAAGLAGLRLLQAPVRLQQGLVGVRLPVLSWFASSAATTLRVAPQRSRHIRKLSHGVLKLRASYPLTGAEADPNARTVVAGL